MKLSDLDEVKRLAQTRAKLVAELEEIRRAETAMIDMTSTVPGSGVLKVLLVRGTATVATPEEILFTAVIEVLVMGFERRLGVIDARLGEIGVTP